MSGIISDNNSSAGFGRAFIRTVGAPREKVNAAIVAAKEIGPDCDFIVTDKFCDTTIEIVYPETTPKAAYDNIMRTILSALDGFVYAMDNTTLAQRLYELLQLRRMKISVAESFTGGGISKRLVEVPGISEVFFEGLNTYSNESKISRLGVDELTLKQHGAVSAEVAYQMAEGLINTGNCDICIATTGIAGPKSDNTIKPVGLVFIAVGTKEKISVYQYQLKGGRQFITETAINLALFLAFKRVK